MHICDRSGLLTLQWYGKGARETWSGLFLRLVLHTAESGTLLGWVEVGSGWLFGSSFCFVLL
jgi:hypothetical protein